MRIHCLIAIVLAVPVFSQIPATSKPSFEVASVKPSLSNESYMDGTAGGRFVATGIPLRMLITDAYGIRAIRSLVVQAG